MFNAVRRRAAAVMYDSGFTRDEFETYVGKPRGYSSVVHPGIGIEWFERPTGQGEVDSPQLKSPYFVYVGNIKPHKNVWLLIEAFSLVARELDARLVIIGQRENLRTADVRVQEELSSLPNVLALGTIDAPLLRSYVRHATALVLPSLYEGFGFPPLEAMAAETITQRGARELPAPRRAD